jgi:hypothetical protein
MEDRGKIIKEVIASYGIKESHVWKKLGISKDTFIRLKKTTNVPDQDVERIGHIIRHDFRKEIPGLKITVFENEKPLTLAAEPTPMFPEAFMKQVLADLAELKNRLPKPDK